MAHVDITPCLVCPKDNLGGRNLVLFSYSHVWYVVGTVMEGNLGIPSPIFVVRPPSTESWVEDPGMEGIPEGDDHPALVTIHL